MGAIRLELPAELRRIAEQAAAADVGHLPLKAGRGRKTDNRAAVVGRIAGRAYRELTGRPPTFTTDPSSGARGGPWPLFLRSVFEAMHIGGHGDHLARTVAEAMRPAPGGPDGGEISMIR